MQPVRPNAKRANLAIVMICISTFIELMSLFYELIYSVVGMESYTIGIGQGLWELSSLVISTISIVTFLQWFRRAYFNLYQKLDGRLSHTDGWTVAYWFIPILNLFKPYQLMKEMYEETDKYLISQNNEAYFTQRIKTNYVGSWWFFMIFGAIISILLSALLGDLSSDTGQSFGIIIISAFYALFSTLLTISVIKDYSKIEPFLLEEPINEIGAENS